MHTQLDDQHQNEQPSQAQESSTQALKPVPGDSSFILHPSSFVPRPPLSASRSAEVLRAVRNMVRQWRRRGRRPPPGMDAGDVYQEVALAVWQKARRWRPRENGKTLREFCHVAARQKLADLASLLPQPLDGASDVDALVL